MNSVEAKTDMRPDARDPRLTEEEAIAIARRLVKKHIGASFSAGPAGVLDFHYEGSHDDGPFDRWRIGILDSNSSCSAIVIVDDRTKKATFEE